MKSFAYVNPTSEKEAVGALGTDRTKVLPLAGGQDLLARLKDYIDQPDRLVNVKSALYGRAFWGAGHFVAAAPGFVDQLEQFLNSVP